MTYLNRTLEQFFLKASKQFPIMLVTGPRQVGKTTFLKHLAEPNRTYITLDDPLICSLAQEDPALFFQRFTPPVLIDEIQYAPQLLPHIKMIVDQNRQPNMFWLTGSQQFHLMNGVSESLAGRVGIVNLLGFSQRELEKKSTDAPFIPTEVILKERANNRTILLPELFERIWKGSYPQLWTTDSDRDLFYQSYVQTYLQRDVRDLANVGDISVFLRFFRTCAARTGQLLNIQNLCRDADITHITGKRWLSILEISGIIYFLEPYHSNFNKRLIKTSKLYFLDTGLAAWLTEWSSPKTLEAGAMSGEFLETWVIAELIKSWWHNGKRAPFYYYRDKDKKEVDLLIHQDGILYPIEIKKTASPTRKSVRHFSVLKNLTVPIGAGCLISLATMQMPLTSEVTLIPIGMI